MRTGREKIESKLRMTEEEKTIVNIQRTIEDIQEFDAMLCRLEALAGLPLFLPIEADSKTAGSSRFSK